MKHSYVVFLFQSCVFYLFSLAYVHHLKPHYWHTSSFRKHLGVTSVPCVNTSNKMKDFVDVWMGRAGVTQNKRPRKTRRPAKSCRPPPHLFSSFTQLPSLLPHHPFYYNDNRIWRVALLLLSELGLVISLPAPLL